MAEKDKIPPGSNPDQGPSNNDSDDSILDFGMTASVREGASGVIPLADLPDPQSSPSLVSWTEVIRQHRETAQTPGMESALEPMTIDSTSDKDLLARIAEEEQAAQQVPAAEPTDRDTDKLKKVPIHQNKTGSSIQLDRDVDDASAQPRSGSAVRFDMSEPPSDAGGAMPSPWADAMIMEAMPVDEADLGDEDIPIAEAIPVESSDDELTFAAEMAGAGASGSVVNLHGESHDDIMEMPLEDEGSPAGRSSILDMLVQDDELEQAGMARAPSDIVDVTAGPQPGVLSGADSGRQPAPPAFTDDEDVDAPWTGPPSSPAIDLGSENAEEAVDLYSEGPVSRGISDSGSFQVSDEELEEASRRQRAIESSAIDLSSSPSSSTFEMELDANAAEEDEAAIDMTLPDTEDAAGQSSMIRRADLEEEEEQVAAQLSKKQKKQTPPPQDDEDLPPPLPPRTKKTREPAKTPPKANVAVEAENESPFVETETPRQTARAPKNDKADRPQKKRGGMFIGMFLGILLAAGGIGAAWYLKQLPSPDTVFGEGEGAAKNNDGKGNDGDLAKAKKDAEDAKKAADDRIASIGKQLKEAGIDNANLEDGLKSAIEGKASAEAKLKDSETALSDAMKAKELAAAEIAAIADKVKPKKDQKVADAIQEIVAARTKAEEDQKKAELAIEGAAKQLKDAGIDDPKLEDGLKKAIAGKTDAETKVKNALAALDKAGVKDPDVAKALAMLIAAKDSSDATAKGVRERLEKAKIVAADADQAALLKAIDDAITRGSADAVVKLAAEKKAAEDRATALDTDLKKTKKENEAIVAKAKDDLAAQKTTYEAKLTDVRTPAQVVDVWLPALADKDKNANAAAAIADADLVMKNAASTDADKAKALAVKALALRNQGKLTEARAAFDEARKHPGHAKDQPWGKAVASAADLLENPAAFVGASQPVVPATQQQLLERVESGLKLFDGEKFAKDRARLIAQRSLLKLDANDLPAALADADEAIKAGAGADAQFAMGRVLEAQGKHADAESAYREVLKAQPEGSPLHKQASLGLARVLLQKIRSAQPPATPTTMGSLPLAEREDYLPQMALMLILLAEPADFIPPDIQEALKLADALIAQKEFHGYIIKADALAKLGRFNDALNAYSTGIKALKVLPKEYDGVLDRILAQHPALQKPDPNVQPDPSRSLKHYAQGLEFYRDQKFAKAEEQFIAAIRHWNKDARYLYYLGLSRWSVGNEKVAAEDFKAGALLEMKGRPLPHVITEAFERIQGEPRAAVEAFRP